MFFGIYLALNAVALDAHSSSLRGTNAANSIKTPKPIHINQQHNSSLTLTASQNIADNSTKSHIFSASAKYLFNGEITSIPSFSNIENAHPRQDQNITRRNMSIRPSTQDDTPQQNINIMKGAVKALFYSVIHPVSRNKSSDNSCSEYTVIDMAIAYDSTYCQDMNGKENAESEIQTIVSKVSNAFKKNGLCMKVEISYMEGYCDVTIDPYNPILTRHAGMQSTLDDFMDYWNENKTDVNRTVAHLFTAYKMSSNTVGLGYIGVACKKRYAYSVNEVSWSKDIENRAGLVAHELGHNMGAEHIADEGCENYVMKPQITSGSSGFSDVSIESIREHAGKVTCMRKEFT